MATPPSRTPLRAGPTRASPLAVGPVGCLNPIRPVTSTLASRWRPRSTLELVGVQHRRRLLIGGCSCVRRGCSLEVIEASPIATWDPISGNRTALPHRAKALVNEVTRVLAPHTQSTSASSTDFARARTRPATRPTRWPHPRIQARRMTRRVSAPHRHHRFNYAVCVPGSCSARCEATSTNASMFRTPMRSLRPSAWRTAFA